MRGHLRPPPVILALYATNHGQKARMYQCRYPHRLRSCASTSRLLEYRQEVDHPPLQRMRSAHRLVTPHKHPIRLIEEHNPVILLAFLQLIEHVNELRKFCERTSTTSRQPPHRLAVNGRHEASERVSKRGGRLSTYHPISSSVAAARGSVRRQTCP